MLNLKMPREQKTVLIEQLRTFIWEERNEEIGELAAENLLDFIMELTGPIIYNQALEDARQAIVQRAANMEDDLDVLKKPLRLITRK